MERKNQDLFGQIRKTVNTVDYDYVENHAIVSFVDTAGKWRRLWEGMDRQHADTY